MDPDMKSHKGVESHTNQLMLDSTSQRKKCTSPIELSLDSDNGHHSGENSP